MHIPCGRGLLCCAQHLAAALAGGVADGVLPAGDFGSDGVGGVGGGTLVIAPEECLAHRTAPEPLVRGGPDAPPENVNRLHVLTHPGAHAAAGGGTCLCMHHACASIHTHASCACASCACPLHLHSRPVRAANTRAASSAIAHQAQPLWMNAFASRFRKHCISTFLNVAVSKGMAFNRVQHHNLAVRIALKYRRSRAKNVPAE